MQDIKIKVRSPEHSRLIQKMLFAVGCSWSDGKTVQLTGAHYLFVGQLIITCAYALNGFSFDKAKGLEVNLDWLLPITHKIIIDGKEIEISAESYAALKEGLK